MFALNKASKIAQRSISTISKSERTMTTTSLSGSPTLALVPPGHCQFTDEFLPVPLQSRTEVSETSSVLRFGLPDPSKPLNLSTCACILAKADLPDDRDGKTEAVIRPYTPISTNASIGHFDLLIKDYGEHGRLSTYLTEELLPGEDTVQFKHIDLNVKIQAPFQQTHIGMLVGGTGITPMIQALHAILGDPASSTRATMLYGSRVSSDILGQELLDQWSDDAESNRLSVTHVLSHEPEDSKWTGARGHIEKELIAKHMPSPDDKDGIIFVCGPPPMYNALCGPRDAKELSGLLAEMGYTSEQVYKF